MKKIKVAVIGTGFIGRGIVQVIHKQKDMEVVTVVNRSLSKLVKVAPFLAHNALATTTTSNIFKKDFDILVEATGSIRDGARIVAKALDNKKHVILMNGELDEAVGWLLAKRAEKNGVILSSDAGDEHGVLARLIQEVKSMGFEIVMAGQDKGFLDRYANPLTQEQYNPYGLNINRCVSFTDGTKLAIEMAIVANAFDLNLYCTGMHGPSVRNVKDVLKVFRLGTARLAGGVVDYVLSEHAIGCVFVVGYSKNSDDQFYMKYYKMGDGPYYLFWRPYHLCHFETPFAIRRIMNDNKPILVQKSKIFKVSAYAKKNLKAGEKLDGIGGFIAYGVIEGMGTPNLPIWVCETCKGVEINKPIKKDKPLTWEDISVGGGP
jgi:predicted homoserine dehydrogenase-like protein